jgi:GNAT superfamily N-acetyltransferase
LNINLTTNDLTVSEFSMLRSSVGLSILPNAQIEKALKNSLYTVCARDADTAIAMGRLVGDGAYVYYLQNINVDPNYQGKGIGSLIINNILNYIKENKLPNTSVMILLMSSKGSENFYKKFGFRSRPNDNEGPGMIMNL